MNFDPEETALLVVDMQNDFCHPEGALYAPMSESAIMPCNELIRQARDVGVRIAFTFDTHEPDQFADATYYDEFDRWGKHCTSDWGRKLHRNVDIDMSDFRVEKATYDAFEGTDLDQWLANNDTRNVLICGTLANVCVMHTAASAALNDYKPVVVEDALGYIEPEHKEYAVKHTDFLFGETTTINEVTFNDTF